MGLAYCAHHCRLGSAPFCDEPCTMSHARWALIDRQGSPGRGIGCLQECGPPSATRALGKGQVRAETSLEAYEVHRTFGTKSELWVPALTNTLDKSTEVCEVTYARLGQDDLRNSKTSDILDLHDHLRRASVEVRGGASGLASSSIEPSRHSLGLAWRHVCRRCN